MKFALNSQLHSYHILTKDAMFILGLAQRNLTRFEFKFDDTRPIENLNWTNLILILIWIQKYLGFTVSDLVYVLIYYSCISVVMIVLRMFSSHKKMFRWNKKCFWHLIGGSGFLNWPSQGVLYRFSGSYVYTFSLSFETRAFIPVHKWSPHEMVSRILIYLFVSVIFTKYVLYISCKLLMCRSIAKFF